MTVSKIIRVTHYETTDFKVKKNPLKLKIVRIFMHILLEFFYEIGGVCELRSVICLIAKVIWGQSVPWLHLHFYISGIYRELKTFLESHPRVVCFFMCLINLSFWQARTISGDDDSNQSCGKKFFFFKYKVWLFHLYIEWLMFLLSVLD